MQRTASPDIAAGKDHASGPPALGTLIRDLRAAAGWSQAQLAARLCAVSGHATVTREDVSRWEHGRRTPGPYWRPHIADVLQIPLATLEAAVRRREILQLTCLAAAGLAAREPGPAHVPLFTSIASGDAGLLAKIQTSHRTDLALAATAAQDRPAVLRLARWMNDGETPVLRVNAAGILSKIPGGGSADAVALMLRRDYDARGLYLRAVSARAGGTTPVLARELRNPRDTGARWCAAWILGQRGTPAARHALAAALRTEPAAENIRLIGMILNGDETCSS